MTAAEFDAAISAAQARAEEETEASSRKHRAALDLASQVANEELDATHARFAAEMDRIEAEAIAAGLMSSQDERRERRARRTN